MKTTKTGIRVLSLFDGIGCAAEALAQAGVPVERYCAFEINPKAQIGLWSNHIGAELYGDVLSIPKGFRRAGAFDLVVAGSPCQGFSRIGKQLAFDDPRSRLYFEFENVLGDIDPDYFLLENVRMAKKHEAVINSRLGEPYKICASEISHIRRPRNYWTNIEFGPLESVDGSVHDLIDYGLTQENTPGWHRWYAKNRAEKLRKKFTHEFSEKVESVGICQTARQVRNWNGNLVSLPNGKFRFCEPSELERLHGLPSGYTSWMRKPDRYEALGNGWSIEVVRQIFRGMK